MSPPDVIIPFAGDCPHRREALEWTTAQYDLNVIVGYGDAQRWCKAEAVRDGLERSSAEIVVIADADVWCDGLPQAIEAVAQGAGWATPHKNVVRLTERGTAQFIGGQRDRLDVQEPHFGVAGGGICVLRREAYGRVPLDPRFIGWGGEDQSWGYALGTLLGPPTRLRVPLFHLWHPPQARRSRSRGSYENQMLLARYSECRGNPKTMGAVLAEVIGGDRGLLHHADHDHLARLDN